MPVKASLSHSRIGSDVVESDISDSSFAKQLERTASQFISHVWSQCGHRAILGRNVVSKSRLSIKAPLSRHKTRHTREDGSAPYPKSVRKRFTGITKSLPHVAGGRSVRGRGPLRGTAALRSNRGPERLVGAAPRRSWRLLLSDCSLMKEPRLLRI
jgi:hypothetical protein